jgi:2-keto-4-pentenoate hydratase/2-oxohepta-3-ene-1,7-dioic acid hydratase in catechol pathway
MRLTTIFMEAGDTAAVATEGGAVPVSAINRELVRSWPTDMLELIASGALTDLLAWYGGGGRQALERMRADTVGAESVRAAPLYRRPPKIWGIGLNYADHAADLSEKTPRGIPGSFMKPDTTIIGPGDVIRIPVQSRKTTAEGELGVIIGRKCRNVAADNWREVVAGFTTVIDMTAEDILRQNPRYLTVAKSFDTFFSFGPQLVTPEEIPDVSALAVETILNAKVHAANTVANMTFSPSFLVSFLSRVMTLLPGDIISTGTPGAVAIAHGDTVACRISGFQTLTNPVEDSKRRDP